MRIEREADFVGVETGAEAWSSAMSAKGNSIGIGTTRAPVNAAWPPP